MPLSESEVWIHSLELIEKLADFYKNFTKNNCAIGENVHKSGGGESIKD